ncbi:MAG: hypothetical protein WDW38_007134 [Sanguina aurantia]
MAEHLASIFGTEKDRVNCPFYFKIGACRHGDRCSRLHNKPTISQTILMPNMYQNPVLNAPPGPDGLPQQIDARMAQQHFEEFYEDVFEELASFGEIENLNICDNFADHMVGNVYAKFKDENAAAAALLAFQGRYYGGRMILIEFSPVTDFREATCRQYEENTCNRGGYCNFMHLKPIAKDLRKKLFGRYKGDRGGGGGGGGGGGERRRSSRSRSPRQQASSRVRPKWLAICFEPADLRRPPDEYDPPELSEFPRPPGIRRRAGGGRDGERGSARDGGDRRRERDDERGRPREHDAGSERRRERESSEERRAKIASWNQERAPEPPANGGGGHDGGGGGGGGQDPAAQQYHH